MTKLSFNSAVLVAIAFGNSVNAHAQQSDQLHVAVGEARLFPRVTLTSLSNDNVLRNSDPVISSSGFLVAPEALFKAERRGLDIQFGYEGLYGVYDENSLDFNNHLIFANAEAIFGVRRKLDISTSISKGHQSLGTGLTRRSAAVGDEQPEYVDGSIRGSFTYGAPTARFNVAGGIDISRRSYQNRVDVTDGLSYSELLPYGQLSYRLSADARALAQVRFGTYKFDDGNLDRKELQILTGLAFRGGRKLSGEVKLGIIQPDYADASREDSSILTVDTALSYRPSSLSIFGLRVERQLSNEGSLNQANNGSQNIDDTVSMSWRREWSGFISTNALITIDLEEGGCPVDRSDTVNATLDVGFKARRWLILGLGVESTNYTESQCDSAFVDENDYELVELKAFVTLTL
ncbi:MAG: outer membrane beta-barrel protein [Gammaproteobacteria bacterium]